MGPSVIRILADGLGEDLEGLPGQAQFLQDHCSAEPDLHIIRVQSEGPIIVLKGQIESAGFPVSVAPVAIDLRVLIVVGNRAVVVFDGLFVLSQSAIGQAPFE